MDSDLQYAIGGSIHLYKSFEARDSHKGATVGASESMVRTARDSLYVRIRVAGCGGGDGRLSAVYQ